MPYSSFTFNQVVSDFNLGIFEIDLFAKVPDLEPSNLLMEILQFNQKMPLSSEKARSEFIVSPILLEIKKKNDAISIHSGSNLEADLEKNLNGECDFILSFQPDVPTVLAPIFAMVEAKKQDIEVGLGQCIAQMLGAKIFNEKKNKPYSVIYGCVTTGEIWQFMKLENNTVFIDQKKYYINEVEKILGVLQWIVDQYIL